MKREYARSDSTVNSFPTYPLNHGIVTILKAVNSATLRDYSLTLPIVLTRVVIALTRDIIGTN